MNKSIQAAPPKGGPARTVAPRQDDPPYEKGEPVALFIPCYVDQFFPKAARATARILERHGVPVVFPKKQTCCGQPAFNSGYWDEAREVVHHFRDTFAGHRWIVSPSGSCSAMGRVFFGHLDTDKRTTDVGLRMFELTEFLVEILGITDTGATFPHKVTMHIGCHTRRELGVLDPPMQLLGNVRDLTYCELPDMEECCGFGGTFSVKMPGTSLAMGQTKVDNIIQSGADVVVSPDLSCLMHIGGILRSNHETRHLQTLHIAEILDAGIALHEIR